MIKDQQVWVRVTQYGAWTIYFTEDSALDDMRRTDKLYTCMMKDWTAL